MNRHVEALAEEFLSRGHYVGVLAPFDPPGRALHGAEPELRETPDYLVPLGCTAGFPANGVVSTSRLVPLIGWNAALGAEIPTVGTFHAYSTKAAPNHIATALGRVFNRLSARIAISEAAAWAGRRWFGGHYEIVPNGVDVSAASAGPMPASEMLRIAFVGRPERARAAGLARRVQRLEHVPSRLSVIGAQREDVLRHLADPEAMRWIDVQGRVSGERLWRSLHEADVLCAPSLSGESFGMVLTEAFAAGTPVIASVIAGYSDVTDGADGVLVPPGDAQRLAEELQRAHHERERLATMASAARRSAERTPGHACGPSERRLRAGDRGAGPFDHARARRPLGRDSSR